MIWVGRDLKSHPVPPPAKGRDTFHWPRLLQAPMSNLALGTARDPGAATAALGTLCQGLPTLPGNNSFPISHPALPSGTGKPFLAPGPPCLGNCLSPGFLQLLQALQGHPELTPKLLLSRLKISWIFHKSFMDFIHYHDQICLLNSLSDSAI